MKVRSGDSEWVFMCSAEISAEPIRCQLSREESHMIIVIVAASADNDTKANAREEIIISSVKELGYDSLKPKQLEGCE